MKEHKRDFIPFSFYDLTGMARHLEEMAAKGWMVERMSNFGWRYRRIPPQKLHFTVTYYPRASEFDPEPGEDQLTFQDFCRHSGWKLAAASGQLQVFCNEQDDPVPIATDPEPELRTMERVARRVIPVYLLLLAIGLFMGAGWIYSLFHDPISLLSSPSSLFGGLCWLVLGVYFLVDLARYFLWHRRAKQAARLGQFVPTRGSHRLMLALLVLVVLDLLYWFFAVRLPGLRLLMAAMLLTYVVLMLAVNGVKGFLKGKKASAKLNRRATFAVALVLSLVIWGGFTAALFRGLSNGSFSLWKDDGEFFPLTVEALTGQDGASVQSVLTDRSVFLSRSEYYQHADWGTEEMVRVPSLQYTVVDVHFSPLYKLCFQQLYHERDDWSGTGEAGEEISPYYTYQPIDPVPWGAQSAWRLYGLDGHATDYYLLCWPGRLVELNPHWELTEEQMVLVGEVLGRP